MSPSLQGEDRLVRNDRGTAEHGKWLRWVLLPGELHVDIDTDGGPKKDVGLQANIYLRLHV